MMMSGKDREEVEKLGFDPSAIEYQLKQFESGFPFLELKAPATVSAGIVQVDDAQKAYLIGKYESYSGKRVKFVPASGAATRMFKSLYEAKDLLEKGEAKESVFERLKDVKLVFDSLEKFAFFPELKEICTSKGISLGDLSSADCAVVLSLILGEGGLNYGNLPKGLVKFHSYTNGARKAVTEHLVEGAEYAKNGDSSVCIHFTVSPNHLEGFKVEVAKSKEAVEKKYGVSISADYSIQKPSTDTIAVNLDNTPFRGNDDKLVFRPAGHGALLENLNEISGDIIFIKNIDNVVPDSLKSTTVEYKKVLAGLLVDVQKRAFAVLQALDADASDEKALADGRSLIEQLGGNLSKLDNLSGIAKADYIKSFLNRPIRVCGMVKNQGEPGGGPFMALNTEGGYSLQIVESSQIDLKNPDQKAIFDSSTHFNPVDLVCGVKNYKGEKFDLRNFRDPKTGFISIKSKDGRELKAMELPGLWNGAMSNWITLFVEVPLLTFNPVKSINDLLRVEHQ
jgi:hypothetical protein